MSDGDRAPRTRVGTAGWSYPDWRGAVYPERPAKDFDELRYLAAYVDVIEVNTSFYRPPPPKMTRSWVERVDGLDEFRFTAKLFRGFTHAEVEEWDPSDVEAFRDGLEPLAESGRLGALLAQFPFHFDARPEHLDRIARIAETFGDVAPIVVEPRHRSFTAAAPLKRLGELGLSFCNVDQPLARTSIEPGARVTGPVGYFRLHGRNREAWFKKGAGRDEKYDYLYSGEELRRFVPLVRQLAERTHELFVVANNHFLGKAAANALELTALLEPDRPVDVPPALLETYPRLRALEPDEGDP